MATYSSILDWKIPYSLAGYSPWSHKELDTTKTHTHTLFEKQQLRKHCMSALKHFACSENSSCNDYTHNTGTRPFPLRSPKASKEKHLELFSLAW